MYDSLSGPILFYLDIIYWYARAFKDVRMYSKFVLTNSTVIAFYSNFLHFLVSVEKKVDYGGSPTFRICERASFY